MCNKQYNFFFIFPAKLFTFSKIQSFVSRSDDMRPGVPCHLKPKRGDKLQFFVADRMTLHNNKNIIRQIGKLTSAKTSLKIDY